MSEKEKKKKKKINVTQSYSSFFFSFFAHWICVWIHICSKHLRFKVFFFFFGKARFCCCFQFSVGLMYCSWDAQTSLFSNFFIKNGSYGTIYTFKNYFTIVFSVFSFQQNKQYPNGSWVQIRTNNNLYIRFVVKIL